MPVHNINNSSVFNCRGMGEGGGVRISRDVGVREEYLKMWGEGVDNKMEGEGGYDFYISAFTGNG